MNIRKKLEKFIDTRPFSDKQLCEMWKKWEKNMKPKEALKENECKYLPYHLATSKIGNYS